MKTYRWYFAGAALAAASLVALAALLPPLGTMDLSAFDEYYHDSDANTLAIDNVIAGGIVSSSTLVVFDKKGVEKSRALFTQAVGMTNVRIEYYEKGWAILCAYGDTDIFYSLKVSKTITVYGTNTENNMNFRFAGKAGVVSYIGGTQQAQLFDKKLAPVGAPVALIGQPRGPHDNSLNGGTFFYCQAGGQIQVWKVKKGLELVIQDTGAWDLINEAKRLCCIQDNDTHKIYSYK